MNAPPMSAEPGPHDSQKAQTAGENVPGRGKTATSACERCRRRKIRCDGDTPCATCQRFGIRCRRTQKSDTQALEQRVGQLEAKIAELTASLLFNARNPISPANEAPRPWAPDLRLITDLGCSRSAVATGQPFIADDRSSTIDIPRIEVVDYESSSPSALAPSPSICPLVPAASCSSPGCLDGALRPPNAVAAISPPMTACASPNRDTMPLLSPASISTPRSRSSSVSTINLDYGWASGSSTFSALSGLTEAGLNRNAFQTVTDVLDAEAPCPPTKFEAETMLDRFFDRTQGLSGYPLDRSVLFEFLDIISNQPECATGSCSISMARFHIYMAMAIGLLMEAGSRATTDQLLHNCYRLAMDEARWPSFWKQPFAVEAAMLLLLFARVSGQGLGQSEV